MVISIPFIDDSASSKVLTLSLYLSISAMLLIEESAKHDLVETMQSYLGVVLGMYVIVITSDML